MGDVTMLKDALVPHLWLDGVSKNYGDFKALDDIAFKAKKGEMLCLLGPSGCGKTTALRIIAGLEDEHEGCVRFSGRDVSFYPVSKRNIGIVFQSYALFPNLTAGENVAYGLLCHGVSKAESRLQSSKLLELVGLPGIDGKYPAQMSGGQQQRVALARAMALSPEILLLDEPLSALDAQVRVHLRTEIKRLQREMGITTVMVTHDQEEGMTMADRIILMRAGKIVQDASPGDLYDNPVSTFAASFLGTMNFLPAVHTETGTSMVGFYENTMRVAESAWKTDYDAERACQLAIRPEDILLQAPDAQDDTAQMQNSFLGRVLHVEYRGALYRVKVRLDCVGEDCPEVIVDVSARVAGRLDLSKNGLVQVVFPAELMHVYVN